MSVHDTYSVSVVIPTRNRLPDLLACVHSLTTQQHLPDEIVILDSSVCRDTNRIMEIVKGTNISIRHLYSAPGANLARNRGIEESKGEIILILDDDVILDAGYINEILYVFSSSRDNELGCVTGNILNENQEKQGMIQTLGNFLLAMFFLPRSGLGHFQLSGFPTIPSYLNTSTYSSVFPTNNVAIKKEVLEKFKFDERLDEIISETGVSFRGAGHADDDDISYRISRKYRIMYDHKAKLIHNKATITSYKRTSKFVYYRNLIPKNYYVLSKNFGLKIQNKLAFSLSIIGLMLIELIQSDIRKSGIRGMIIGIKDCLWKQGCARYL